MLLGARLGMAPELLASIINSSVSLSDHLAPATKVLLVLKFRWGGVFLRDIRVARIGHQRYRSA